eukprot:jgi/Chrzof1/2814/UNPLg00731.t1
MWFCRAKSKPYYLAPQRYHHATITAYPTPLRCVFVIISAPQWHLHGHGCNKGSRPGALTPVIRGASLLHPLRASYLFIYSTRAQDTHKHQRYACLVLRMMILHVTCTVKTISTTTGDGDQACCPSLFVDTQQHAKP